MKNPLKKTMIVLGALFVGLFVLGLIGMAAGVETDEKPAEAKTVEPAAPSPGEQTKDDGARREMTRQIETAREQLQQEANDEPVEPVELAEPQMTSAQENALASAQDYLDM